jgi:hypothetical protein
MEEIQRFEFLNSRIFLKTHYLPEVGKQFAAPPT